MNRKLEWGPRGEGVVDRLIRKSIPVPEAGCWLWLGAVNHNGHGICTTRSGSRLAHVASFTAFVRPVLPCEVVRHKCDTPSCINPEHLLAGSQRDNVMDMIDRGRHWSHQKTYQPPCGDLHHSAKLRDSDVLAIKQAKIIGESLGSIAKRYGVTKQAIWYTCKGKRKGVTP